MALEIHPRRPQGLDEVAALLAPEPVHDALGRDAADIGHRRQGLHVRRHQGVQTAELTGQHLPRLLPHLPDAEGKEQPGKVVFLGALNGGNEIIRTLLAHPLQIGHVLRLEGVEVAGAFHQTGIDQTFHHRRAKALDVHGVPAGKVGQVAQQLGRALRAGAADVSPVLVPGHGSPAHRTDGGQQIGLRPLGAPVLQHRYNFRDDLPRLLHQHRVPNADVFLGNEILVMQGSVGDGGTRQTDRLHHRLGGQHAGAPHLHHDIHHFGGFLLRRILVGRRPAGEFGRGAQNGPLGEVVDLHHRAVDVKGILFPAVADGGDPLAHLFDGGAGLMGNDLEMLAFQILQGFGVGAEGLALRQLDVEDLDIQFAGGGDPGVVLPQRTGGGVAGVGKEGLALHLQLGVEGFKNLLGHIDLPPDDEPGQRLGKAQGDGADGAQIFRHVLSHPAVAPGGAPDKHAVFILQRHRKAVHLGLHVVFHPIGQGLFHPLAELAQLLQGEDVLQALQRHRMLHLRKAVGHRAPHPAGGRIGGVQLRVFGLQLLQAAELMVKVVVAHLGGVQHIILVVGFLKLLTQGQNLLFLVHIAPPLGMFLSSWAAAGTKGHKAQSPAVRPGY